MYIRKEQIKIKHYKMKIKIIKTKKDYHKALKRFEEIFSAKRGTKESDEADVLALLIRDYEDKNFISDTPDPLKAIKFRMEE